MDRLFRCYKGELSHVEENILYQHILQLDFQKGKEILEKHFREIKELGTI